MTRLTFVGDIACDRPLLRAARKWGKYDFSRVFQTSGVFKNSDLVIGNLESCFGGGHYGTKPYHYSVPDSFCDAIRDAGFDIVSTANNHCLDEGVEGLNRTLKILDKNGIAHTGTFSGEDQEKRYLVKEINGIRISFYSLTYGVNTTIESSACEDVSKYVNVLNFRKKVYSGNPVKRCWQVRIRPALKKTYRTARYGTIIHQHTDILSPNSINQEWLTRIDDQVKKAREETDILVVLLHIGGQFNPEPGTFSEYMVKHLSDLGADIIAGHHPHTVQRIDNLGDTHVAYSLGGYCLSPSASYLVRESLPEYSAAWHIDIDEDKRIVATSAQILQCVEDADRYVHVIEAKESSADLDLIKERLGSKPKLTIINCV